MSYNPKKILDISSLCPLFHIPMLGSVTEPRFLKLFYRRVSGLMGNGDANRLDSMDIWMRWGV